MRLLSVEITNFRVIRKARLEFADQVIGIIGPNGAGKSSIIEAIAWSLYGNPVARSGKDEIKSTFAAPAESCEVALDFEVGREHYQAVRRLVGKTERAEASLSCGGRTEAVGSSETIVRVSQLLGLDRRGFLTSFLARQQELNALADLPPAQRRDHLAGMLGISKLDRALKRIKDDSRLSAQKVDLLARQVEKKESVTARLAELQEHANKYKYQLDTRTGAFNEARLTLGETERQYREHQEKQAACSRLSAQIEGTSASREHISKSLGELNLREAELQKGTIEIESLTPKVAELDPLKRKLDELKLVAGKTAQRAQMTDRLKSIQIQTKTAGENLTRQQAELAAIVKALELIPENIADLRSRSVSSLETIRVEWTESRADLKATELQIGRLEEQIQSMSEIGSETVCDRCHRPFGDDLPTIKEHLNSELESLNRAAGEFREKAATQKERGQVLKDQTDELEKQSRQKEQSAIKQDMLNREVDSLQGQLKSQATEQAELESRLNQLGESAFDPGQLRLVADQVSELEKQSARVHHLRGLVSDLPATLRSIEKATAQLTGLELELDRLEKQHSELDWDEAAFTEIKQRFAADQEKLETARVAKQETESELAVIKKEQELRFEEIGALNKMADELEDCRTDRFYLEKLTTLFVEFRKHMIGGIRPRLERLASDLISEMSGGRYSFVKLDSDYNLHLMDYDKYFGIDRFSGGEKDLASLCLRLAISLALTEAAGLDRSFIILDEVFGSQDSTRRDLIFESLANLKGRFPQMLLITHLEELKDKVEALVEVEKVDSGWSEVRANGN